MYVKFGTTENTIRSYDRKEEYHQDELNGKKIVEMKFIEEHEGEVVYKVKLENGIIILAFGDEIISHCIQ